MIFFGGVGFLIGGLSTMNPLFIALGVSCLIGGLVLYGLEAKKAVLAAANDKLVLTNTTSYTPSYQMSPQISCRVNYSNSRNLDQANKSYLGSFTNIFSKKKTSNSKNDFFSELNIEGQNIRY